MEKTAIETKMISQVPIEQETPAEEKESGNVNMFNVVHKKSRVMWESGHKLALERESIVDIAEKLDKPELVETFDGILQSLAGFAMMLKQFSSELLPEGKVVGEEQIKTLISLADKLDEDGKHEEAEAIDSMLKVFATKSGDVESIKTETLSKLAGMADELDEAGIAEAANKIDEFMAKYAEDYKYQGESDKTEQSKRYDSKHHHSEQIREPKKPGKETVDVEGRKNHHVHTYQQTGVGALSTRYCPEHVGVSLQRIGENIYQCSLDGQVYNWETGWTDYNGDQHPGGSVAGQTPNSTEYAIPHRIFDSREKIMNVVN